MWSFNKVKKSVFLSWVMGLTCLFPHLLHGQSADFFLDKGRQFYRTDQADSARMAYQAAYRLGTPNTQLYALSGLIKTSILQSRMEEADSLVQIGMKLDKDPAIGLQASCSFALTVGEFYRKNSEFERALKSHKSVIARSKKLTEDKLPYADALFYTALSFERLRNYDSSVYYITRAYEVYKTLMDTTDLRFSSIYNGMGVCFYRANRLEESKAYYLLAKSIAEKQAGPASSDLALCLVNLASIYRAEENYQEAIRVTEQALRIFHYLGDQDGVAGAYYGLGVYHYFLGDYGKTKAYMQTCITIREGLFHKNHYSLIGPYEVLGITYEESGDYEQTLLMLEKAQEKIVANYGPKSLVEGFNCENRAITLKIIGQMDSALKYIRLAHEILPLHLDPNDYSMAVNCYNYADILFQLGQTAQARELLQKSLRIYEAQGMETSSENAQNLVLMALIAESEGNWTKSGQLFEQAMKQVHLSAMDEMPSYKLNPVVLSILNDYTDHLFRKYQSTRSEAILEDLKSYAGLYLRLSEQFRLRFNDPYTKSILIKKNAESHQQKVGIYNLLYKESQNPEYLNEAYLFSEYSRASMLRDLQNDKIRSYAGLPDSLLQKERNLKKEISSLSEMLLENGDSLKLQQELLQARNKLDVHIGEMSQNYPRYHRLRFASQVPQLDSLLSRLPEGHNLIQYMQDDTAYYALLVNKRTTWLGYLGNRKKINESIQDWRLAITRRKKSLPDEGLLQSLWHPFKDRLQGDRIIIVPVGQLFYLNFELLSEGMRFLIEDYNISYALSFSVYFPQKEEKKAGKLVAIAPGFEEKLKEAYLNQLDSLELPDEGYLRTLRQPWSVRFVEELRQRFSNHSLAGFEATESQVKAKLPEGKVIYFGTHAIAEAEDPLQSRLLLAKEIGEQTEDGYLHAYELYGLALDADLAILSACESGLGKLQQGEGMISLAYSIHYSGCPSTVMSLWKVDEKTNTEISRNFLEKLSKGMSKSEALREAKLEYLREGSQPHPFYWGGMVLMGTDGPIHLKEKYPFQPVLLVLIGLILIILMVYLLRSRKKLP